MIALIDTSSLLSFVGYYLPFDKDDRLFKYIQRKIELKKIIVLDKVYEESNKVAKGIITENDNKLLKSYLRSVRYWDLGI